MGSPHRGRQAPASRPEGGRLAAQAAPASCSSSACLSYTSWAVLARLRGQRRFGKMRSRLRVGGVAEGVKANCSESPVNWCTSPPPATLSYFRGSVELMWLNLAVVVVVVARAPFPQASASSLSRRFPLLRQQQIVHASASRPRKKDFSRNPSPETHAPVSSNPDTHNKSRRRAFIVKHPRSDRAWFAYPRWTSRTHCMEAARPQDSASRQRQKGLWRTTANPHVPLCSRLVNLGVGVIMVLGGISQFFPLGLYDTPCIPNLCMTAVSWAVCHGRPGNHDKKRSKDWAADFGF